MSWKVDIGASCIGSGMCAAIDPEQFSLDGGIARAHSALVDPDDRYVDAAESCPASAITITDANTGAVIAPE